MRSSLVLTYRIHSKPLILFIVKITEKSMQKKGLTLGGTVQFIVGNVSAQSPGIFTKIVNEKFKKWKRLSRATLYVAYTLHTVPVMVVSELRIIHYFLTKLEF